MPIDLASDKLLTLAAACKMLPHRPSPSTLWRWRTHGVNGVKLECVRAGNRWYTTAAAMCEFLRRQTEVTTRTADQESGDQRSEEMLARLKKAGLIQNEEGQ